MFGSRQRQLPSWGTKSGRGKNRRKRNKTQTGNISSSFFYSAATYLSFGSRLCDSSHHTLYWIFTFNEVAECCFSLLSLIKFYWLLGHSINGENITYKWKSCPEATGKLFVLEKKSTQCKKNVIASPIQSCALPNDPALLEPCNPDTPSLKIHLMWRDRTCVSAETRGRRKLMCDFTWAIKTHIISRSLSAPRQQGTCRGLKESWGNTRVIYLAVHL